MPRSTLPTVVWSIAPIASATVIPSAGGVITAIPFRGQGFSKITLSALCAELKLEKKEIFSFYYIPSAKNMHHSIGFEEIGIWAKLIK